MTDAEAKLAERHEIEDARRRHRELFGDTASPVDHNQPLPERENRRARRAKAALARLALPVAKRGRRAGGRAAEALIAAQAPGKIGKD